MEIRVFLPELIDADRSGWVIRSPQPRPLAPYDHSLATRKPYSHLDDLDAWETQPPLPFTGTEIRQLVCEMVAHGGHTVVEDDSEDTPILWPMIVIRRFPSEDYRRSYTVHLRYLEEKTSFFRILPRLKEMPISEDNGQVLPGLEYWGNRDFTVDRKEVLDHVADLVSRSLAFLGNRIVAQRGHTVTPTDAG